MSTDACRTLLNEVGESLRESADAVHDIRRIRAALDGPDVELRAFLESNELWGGAGSLADQAGMDLPSEAQSRFHAALYQLGQEQLRQGIANVRTQPWVNFLRRRPRMGNEL